MFNLFFLRFEAFARAFRSRHLVPENLALPKALLRQVQASCSRYGEKEWRHLRRGWDFGQGQDLIPL
jgi:hypothetical protein